MTEETSGSLLVHVLAVALRLLQLLDVGGGLLGRLASRLLDDLVEGGVDILGHARGVAADVEVGTLLEPSEEFLGGLQHAVLDIDLLGLVAGERGVETVKDPLRDPGLQLLAVEEVGGGFLVTEEEPVLTGRSGGLALLQEGHEGGDAGAGTDHDRVGRGILGHPEMLRGVDEDRHMALVSAVGEESGADPLALAAMALVAHSGNREMNLGGMRLLGGGDRVEARLELAQALHELLGCELREGMGEQGVDHLAAPDVSLQFGAPLGRYHRQKMGGGRILLRNGGQELLVLLGDHVEPRERLADRDGVAGRVGNLLVSAKAEDAEDLLHERGIVRREHPEGVPDLVLDPGSLEDDLEVARVFGGAFLGQLAVGLELRRKGILAGIEGVGISGHRVRIKGGRFRSSHQEANRRPKERKFFRNLAFGGLTDHTAPDQFTVKVWETVRAEL